MDKRERHAVIASLIKALRAHRSWCGETHVQKAVYFLQQMTGVPTEFEFLLYKHGPFSFDLRDEITAMRADMLLGFEFPRPDYGPSLKLTPNMEALRRRHRSVVEEAGRAIDFVAERFGDRNVAELERLGTALYACRKHGDERDPFKLARRIVELKPHVHEVEAREAVETVIRWQAEAEALAAAAP